MTPNKIKLIGIPVYKHSDLVDKLLAEGMSKVNILYYLMREYKLSHWDANRETFNRWRHMR